LLKYDIVMAQNRRQGMNEISEMIDLQLNEACLMAERGEKK